MQTAETLLVFLLEGQRYAVRLSSVLRVLPAAEATRLPKAPSLVLGVLSVQGVLTPLIDLRRRFLLPERPMRSSDHVILARTPRRSVCLLVDRTVGVFEIEDSQVVVGNAVFPHLKHLEGLAKLDDGLVLIHDLDRCLSLEEEQELETALKELA